MSRKSQTKKSKFVGSRLVGEDDDPELIMRAFREAPSSKEASRVYTKAGDMTRAFDVTPKKKKKKQLGGEMDEEEDDAEVNEARYGQDGYFTFKMVDYEKELERLSVGFTGNGCNHRNDCPAECRIYHDYMDPPRNHYYHHEGTTSYDRTRYGRFVRESESPLTMVRLCSDPQEESVYYPRDTLFTKGWHHTDECSIDCVRYHYDTGLPERYTRMGLNFFKLDAGGRWLQDHINGELGYIRIGPNDDSEDTLCHRRVGVNTPRDLPPSVETAYHIGPTTVRLGESERARFVHYLTTVVKGGTKDLFHGEMTRAMQSFNGYYTELCRTHPLFAKAVRDDVLDRPHIQFLLLGPVESLESLCSQYPYMEEVLETHHENRGHIQLYIDDKAVIPLLVFTHQKYFLTRFHVVTIVHRERLPLPKRKKSVVIVEEEEEEETVEPVKKKPKKTEKVNEETKKIIKEDNSPPVNTDGHTWEVDMDLSTRQTSVYHCICSGVDSKHYKRRCCARTECKGDGFKVGKSRGRCNLCEAK